MTVNETVALHDIDAGLADAAPHLTASEQRLAVTVYPPPRNRRPGDRPSRRHHDGDARRRGGRSPAGLALTVGPVHARTSSDRTVLTQRFEHVTRQDPVRAGDVPECQWGRRAQNHAASSGEDRTYRAVVVGNTGVYPGEVELGWACRGESSRRS